MIYVIMKEGVYKQRIVGLWHTESRAIIAAKDAISKEKDDYHTMEIYACPVNTPIEDGILTHRVSRRGKEVLVSDLREHVQT